MAHPKGIDNFDELKDILPEFAEDIAAEEEEKTVPPSIEKRFLYGTPIIESTNKNLPLLLASVIYKMYCSPYKRVSLLGENRCYIQLSRENWVWSTRPCEKLNFSQVR